MKQIFTICLVLVVMIGWGQDMLLKMRVEISSDGDTTATANYFYDTNNHLTFQNYIMGDDTTIYTYSNDTLISTSDGYTYEYFDDSTVKYKDGVKILTFHLNDLDEVIDDGYSLYNWFENNMVGYTNESNSYSFEYHLSYINPWYNQNKYFKYYIDGSLNMVSKAFKNDTVLRYEFIVEESIGNYPTKVKYISYLIEDYWFYRHFYYDNITDIPEQDIHPTEILSVSYYNLMGQQIDRPKKGFYIERKLTEKGIISKKHYIP